MGQPCKVGEALASMEGDDLADFQVMLAPENKIGAARVSAALSQIGVHIGATLIGEHKNRICRCYKASTNG